MFVVLGILGEISTVAGSIIINQNSVTNSMLEISKNGYKFDKSLLEKFQLIRKNNNNKIKKSIGMILLFVPGVNLLSACINNATNKKKIINDPLVKEAIIPMTDEEKEEYKNIDKRSNKIKYITYIYSDAKRSEQSKINIEKKLEHEENKQIQPTYENDYFQNEEQYPVLKKTINSKK